MNSKLDDDSICPIDFEQDLDNLHIMSNSSANTLTNIEEIQYSEIYMTTIKNQANISKMNELQSWKKPEVYCEEDTDQMEKMLQKPDSVPEASKKSWTSL